MTDIIENNDYKKLSDQLADKIRHLLWSYDGMSAKLRQALKNLGYVNMFNRRVSRVKELFKENGNPPIDFNVDKIMKTVEDDPMFDKKRAQKKLRAFVEGNPDVIAKKAAMMVEHFHEQVVAKKKIGGKARAMVVTASIPRCIEYYYAINKCLADRHSPYKTIVAFSGEHKYNGQEPALTSAAMNGFPDAKIPKEFKKDPYRILIVADMFQTGFDEPLLQTMYVDKPLYDIAAVQTLSRLNRAHPGKDV